MQIIVLDKRLYISPKRVIDDDGIKFVDFSNYTDEDDLIILNSDASIEGNWLEVFRHYSDSTNCEYGTIGGVLLSEIGRCNTHVDLLKSEKYISNPEQLFYDTETNAIDCLWISKEVIHYMGIPAQEQIAYDYDAIRQWFYDVKASGWKHAVSKQIIIKDGVSFTGYKVLKRGQAFYDRFVKAQDFVRFVNNLSVDYKRKNIVHYLFADFREGKTNNIGGTQIHVKDLVDYQRFYYNVFVIARDRNRILLTAYTNDRMVEFAFEVEDVSSDVFYTSAVHRKVYERIFDAIPVNILHVQHTMNMPLDIYYVAKEHGAAIFFTAHDYYYVCPNLVMKNTQNENCSLSDCNHGDFECVRQKKGIELAGGFANRWSEEHKKALKMVDTIIYPSTSVKKVFEEWDKSLCGKSTIIEHGVSIPSRKDIPNYQHDRKRIAFIGGISEDKGGKLIYEIVSSDNMYDWYVIGGIGYEPLIHLEKDNVHKTGWYKREEIVKILDDNEIDLVCILSIVNETFCYTLSEAIAAKRLVIATDVGALGDRMREYDCGWIVDRKISSQQLLDLVGRITNDCKEYNEKISNLKRTQVKTATKMAQEYIQLYETLLDKQNLIRKSWDILNLEQFWVKLSSDNNIGLNNGLESFERVEYLQKTIQQMQSDIDKLKEERDRINLEYNSYKDEVNNIKGSRLVRFALWLRRLKLGLINRD